jgi:hypothetical protein
MSFVKLPDELKVILVPFVTLLVTEGLKALGSLFQIDLSGKAAAVAGAICGALFFFADALLAKIPPEFEGVANALLMLLVSILGAYGLHRQLVRFGGRTF